MTDYTIVTNQVKCLICGDTPFSRHRHDFVTCKCGAVSVDGGQDYLKRVGDQEDWEEMSFAVEQGATDAMQNGIEWAIRGERNPYGIAMAVLRYLRDAGYTVQGSQEGVEEGVVG